MITPTLILTALAAFAVLLFGRQLFWLFVGVVGFVVAFEVASQYLIDQPEWLILLVALIAGVIGALLSIFVQYGVVAVAGFLAGGFMLQTLLRNLAVAETEDLLWVALIIGGIIGAVLVLVVFDWALIFLSSLTGAGLLIQLIDLPPLLEGIIFATLLIIGIAFQIYMMPRTGALAEPRRRAREK